ncbi:hypothetical protein DPSP01_010473 [Paraphaeosphaeria sporulosa]
MKFPLSMLAHSAAVLAAPTSTDATTDTVLINCTYGFNYGGSDLLSMGNYEGDINNPFTAAGQPTDGDHVLYSLFNSNSVIIGKIEFIKFWGAGGCANAGTGNDDYCPAQSTKNSAMLRTALPTVILAVAPSSASKYLS